MQSMDLDRGANRSIDERLVPECLKSLIPIVKRWSFSSLDQQDAFVRAMKTKPPDELNEFNVLYDHNQEAIREWLDSIPKKNVSEMTENDWRHPIWAFIDLYKNREITGPGLVSRAETDARNKFKEELRQERFSEAASKAAEEFRVKNFGKFIELLSNYEDLLSEAQIKKLNIAKKKHSDS